MQLFSRSSLKLETFPNLHAQEEMDEAMAMLATNSRALFVAITNANKVRPFSSFADGLMGAKSSGETRSELVQAGRSHLLSTRSRVEMVAIALGGK